MDTTSNYTVRQSVLDDISDIMRLYDYSRQLMRDNGNESQWVDGYPSLAQITDDINRGESYVIVDDEKIEGVFAFIIGKDPTYDKIEGGEWIADDQPYGTIHRIAKSADAKGIFDTCLEWCKKQILTIRVDTHRDNRIMLNLMERYGFVYSGIIYVADGTPRLAFQMTDTHTLCEPLQLYIEQEIIPRYKEFDSAHNIDHARTVINNSLQLAEHHDVNINMVYTIAAYHDIGLVAGRDRHHIVSSELLQDDKMLRKWFSPGQIETMAEAVEDHRASSGHEPRSIYGKIVAEADRDIDPIKIVRRTIQYGLNHYPELEKEAHWKRAVDHLNEKYAEGGYLTLWLPESPNAQKLKELRSLINNRKALRDLFERIFEHENGKNKGDGQR